MNFSNQIKNNKHDSDVNSFRVNKTLINLITKCLNIIEVLI